ncbi:tRNA-specific adenosine deaminase TAD3-like [Eucalyptus grandis]|uniref:tRNA-specific adenosine deaminase TAD3-like n=1 Tax=Eucalyptus grandis TaxID=71139 RepID=UPI00192ED315|nr:tRNA-specific adenosine deaminase TAD3-like [Eucalyptus grandis]
MRRLSQIAPLEDLHHVKRVKKKCLEGGLQICCIVNGRVGRTVQAMAHLIPSTNLSSDISGITGFSDEDSQSVVSFMKYALELAKSHGNMVVNAAAIVDPLSNQVIARACDEVCSWQTPKTEVGAECKSSTKSCAEMTGWIKHESCLQCCSSGGAEQVETSISCLHPRQWVDEQTGRSSSFWHLLRHAVMMAIESSAARDRPLFPDVRYKDEATIEEYILSPAKSQTKRRRTDGNDVSFSSTCEGNPGKTFYSSMTNLVQYGEFVWTIALFEWMNPLKYQWFCCQLLEKLGSP